MHASDTIQKLEEYAEVVFRNVIPLKMQIKRKEHDFTHGKVSKPMEIPWKVDGRVKIQMSI